MKLKNTLDYVADFVFHHRLVGIHSEAFGADKVNEGSADYGLRDCEDEESEDVEDDHAEEAGLLLARPEPAGGGWS